MLRKLNRFLRTIFIIMAAVFALFKLVEKIEFEKGPEPEGFQTQEFDDIW